jgi:hypothetical protein
MEDLINNNNGTFCFLLILAVVAIVAIVAIMGVAGDWMDIMFKRKKHD